MLTITRKPIVKAIIDQCIDLYRKEGLVTLTNAVHLKLLSCKIKFPLLEYAASQLHEQLTEDDQLLFCDQIENYKTIGGNVLLGIILQKRLVLNFQESIDKASEYISKANAWYVCDIMGERVLGVSLLLSPQKTLLVFENLSQHDSQWVVRSLGAGAHYAIKKGLDKKSVVQLFLLLLSLGNSKNKEIKQGIGWAAKTTAKFHPEIITNFKAEIENTEKVGQWFRGKVKIGLNRNLYAQRNKR